MHKPEPKVYNDLNADAPDGVADLCARCMGDYLEPMLVPALLEIDIRTRVAEDGDTCAKCGRAMCMGEWVE